MSPGSESAAASRRARRQRRLDQIEIAEGEVSISDELLGIGGFGAVYIGDFLGLNVACKVQGWLPTLSLIIPHHNTVDWALQRLIGSSPRYRTSPRILSKLTLR